MNNGILFIACIVGAIALVVYFVTQILLGNQEGKLRNRLNQSEGGSRPVEPEEEGRLKPIFKKIGQLAAEPFMPKKRETQSDIRRRLGFAGIYAPGAYKVMAAAKVFCLVGGLGGGYTVGMMTNSFWLSLSVGGLIGYLAPTFWLKQRVKKNQQAINYGLPDALDLMVVCVEAGLTVDAAMQRVGQELGIAHPVIGREFGIAHMETRVGLSRAEALRNLHTRTGSPALQSLAAMLIQADRFGTSIATALRVHAETLRTTRQHAAEEMASKASVKMSFPLVLFIFPSTFIVLAGPTVVQLMNSELMK